MESDLLQKLANKSISKETLYKTVAEDFTLLPQVLNGVSSSKPAVRYACGSVLIDLSANYPEKLYPHTNTLIGLMDSKHRILVWNAMAIIANLCAVDVDKKFDAIFDKYYSFIKDEYLVTVANVVGNSSKIAIAKPYLIPKITNELLKVQHISKSPHLTEECKEVIAEHAIKAFSMFFDKMNADEKVNVLLFAKCHLNSQRKMLRKAAEVFLERWAHNY